MAPEGLKIKKILPVNGLLYIQFEQQNFVSITQYQPKNFIKTIDAANFFDQQNFYKLHEEPIVDIDVLGESVVLHDYSGRRIIFVNALVGKEEKGSGGGAGGAGGSKDGGKGKNNFFSSDILTYMLFPASLGAVYYY